MSQLVLVLMRVSKTRVQQILFRLRSHVFVLRKLHDAAIQLEINISIAKVGLRLDPGSQRISNTRESPQYSHAVARQLRHSLTAATQLCRYTCGDSICGILSKQKNSSKTWPKQ